MFVKEYEHWKRFLDFYLKKLQTYPELYIKRRVFIMPLISPGNYNFTYNQEYMMKMLDMNKWGFLIIFLVVTPFIIWFIVISLKSYTYRSNIENEERITAHKDKILRRKEEELTKKRHAIFSEFNTICQEIVDDKQLFGRPIDLIKQMYFPRLRELVRAIDRERGTLYREYRHLIPSYEYYKKIFAEDEHE